MKIKKIIIALATIATIPAVSSAQTMYEAYLETAPLRSQFNNNITLSSGQIPADDAVFNGIKGVIKKVKAEIADKKAAKNIGLSEEEIAKRAEIRARKKAGIREMFREAQTNIAAEKYGPSVLKYADKQGNKTVLSEEEIAKKAEIRARKKACTRAMILDAQMSISADKYGGSFTLYSRNQQSTKQDKENTQLGKVIEDSIIKQVREDKQKTEDK